MAAVPVSHLASLLALLLAGWIHYGPVHWIDVAEGGFALVNAHGDELIALDSIAHPVRLWAAVCAGGRTYEVRFARHQARQAADNGRQIAANFQNMQGEVFRVIKGTAPADQTCYLSGDSVLVAGAVGVDSAAVSQCGPDWLRRLSAIRHRRVLNCWRLAMAKPDIEILAAQFAPVDASALASVVVADGRHVFFQDFPATYRGPDTDTWRADDNGAFTPDGFGILFLSRHRPPDVVALTWAASEGENAYLLVPDSANGLRVVTHSYRYWVPN